MGVSSLLEGYEVLTIFVDNTACVICNTWCTCTYSQRETYGQATYQGTHTGFGKAATGTEYSDIEQGQVCYAFGGTWSIGQSIPAALLAPSLSLIRQARQNRASETPFSPGKARASGSTSLSVTARPPGCCGKDKQAAKSQPYLLTKVWDSEVISSEKGLG